MVYYNAKLDLIGLGITRVGILLSGYYDAWDAFKVFIDSDWELIGKL